MTFVLSIGIGLLLGLLGGGGSILTVPMLVYILHVAPKTAILTSFVVVGISSLIAIIQHARMRRVCWQSGIFFGLAGMAGAVVGGEAAAYFPDIVLMTLFGFVTLVMGIAMLRNRNDQRISRLMQELTAFCPARVPYAKVLFDGLLVGGLTGLVGVGGGFMIVPALTLWVGLPMPAAIGTSLLIIAMNAMAGLTGYSSHVAFDLELTSIVTSGAVLGSLIGGFFSTRFNPALLRRIFGAFVVVTACHVLYQSLSWQLLDLTRQQLLQHREFVLGIVFLGLVLTVYRLGSMIHGVDRKHNV